MHVLHNGYSYLFLGTKYNAVILDVDSKDVTIGMSSPPMEFITPEFLTSLGLILKDGGKLFIIHKASPSSVYL